MVKALVLAIALLGNPQISSPELEHKIYSLINSERINRNIKPLVVDEGLAKIARDHSQDMVNRKFFNHVNPDGNTARDRLRRGGYKCTKASGENIFQNNLGSLEKIATTTVQGWMRSSGHRQNVLQRSYVKTGVGAAIAANGEVFITQVFCG
jgi:uncharacterized protein YkwD